MNNNTRQLIEYICDGNMSLARQQARFILNSDHTEKDRQLLYQGYYICLSYQ